MTNTEKNAAQLVREYRAVRDARAARSAAAKKEDAAFKGVLDRIEMEMMSRLDADGAKSLATTEGTFYKEEQVQPSCTNWEEFYAWVREHDAFSALHKRISSEFIKTYMDDHKDAEGNSLLPPGIAVFREVVVKVNKPRGAE
jgi:hypothetical protein